MRLCPCRFNVPLTDNVGEGIDPEVLINLHRELLELFGGFTVHPTSVGRWRSQEGRLYQEELFVYEAAIPEETVPELRELVCRLGRRLGQPAMYFDAPPPSVEIIDLSGPPDAAAMSGGAGDEPRQRKTTRRRGKKDRPRG